MQQPTRILVTGGAGFIARIWRRTNRRWAYVIAWIIFYRVEGNIDHLLDILFHLIRHDIVVRYRSRLMKFISWRASQSLPTRSSADREPALSVQSICLNSLSA